jgi:hypothetical protein
MLQLSRRQIAILAIALATLVILTLVIAPSAGNLRSRGSSYSRSPDGYGAWYAMMQQRGIKMQRWQKPIQVLLDPKGWDADRYQGAEGAAVPTDPITLIQVGDTLNIEMAPDAVDWIKKGNRLVLLGSSARVSRAEFTSDLESPEGKVRVETRRRYTQKANGNDLQEFVNGTMKPVAVQRTERLGDRFGAVIWQEKIGNGQLIRVSTPYLAANAYQDFRPNYELLAQLVTESKQPIWIDEYIHGYRDRPKENQAESASEDDVFTYLLKTPLGLLLLQILLLLGVLIWGSNRRMGHPTPLPSPQVDNSTAYIQALAGVLANANATSFVHETIGKAEQQAIQRALGLGDTLLPIATVAAAYEQQTGQSAQSLQEMLRMANGQQSSNRADLQGWIDQVRNLRKTLPNR